MVSLVQAAQVQVSWTAPTTNANGSPLTDLGGYRVHYGTSAGQYSTTLDAGIATQVVIAGLAEGQTYYITVTAYDTSQNESTYATEVAYTVPKPPGDTTPPTVGSTLSQTARPTLTPTRPSPWRSARRWMPARSTRPRFSCGTPQARSSPHQ